MIEIKNAMIESTMLGFEDHGILTAMIYLSYGAHASQGFGGYSLEGGGGGGFIRELLTVVGVERWEQLKGKYIRVKCDNQKIYAIGNIIEDKWFNPKEYFDSKNNKS